MMPPKWTYFTPEEVEGLNEEFVALLDRARGLSSVPFIITSGLRTPAQNEQLPNAVSDSSHLAGLAVDLAIQNSADRFSVVKALLEVGLTRIGIYAAHIHADHDASKPPNVMWYIPAA